MPAPQVISTTIRRDNSIDITYVLKKYENNTFTLFTYQKNQSKGCYYLAGKQSGTCVN